MTFHGEEGGGGRMKCVRNDYIENFCEKMRGDSECGKVSGNRKGRIARSVLPRKKMNNLISRISLQDCSPG